MAFYEDVFINMTNAFILNSKKNALMIHNIKNRGDRWEFPGGKRKGRKENLISCVKRELKEELNVEISIKGIFGDYLTETPEGKFLCRTYFAEIVKGVPKIRELKKHDEFRYMNLGQLGFLKSKGILVPNLINAFDRLRHYITT